MQSTHKSSYQRAAIIGAILLALLVILLLIWLLFRPAPPASRVVNCPQSPRDAPQSAEGRFVDRQVIVIGAAQAITAVIAELPEVVEPEPLADCDLDYLGQLPDVSQQVPADLFQPDDLTTLNVRLYKIQSTATVTEAVAAINNASLAQNRRVYADPNYLTISMANADACGNPNSVGGSPNSVGGSAGGATGTPASAETFANQWAFEHIGLGSPLQAYFTATKVTYQGGGVRVGVFDTSPFTLTQAEISASGATPEVEGNAIQRMVDWLPQTYPALNLSVYSSTLPDIQRPAGVLADVNDHGLFVSGLIHAVAPSSDIHLFPVLDRYGCGDLYTLVTRLHRFISKVNADRGSLKGAVINLSLGVLQPRDTDVIAQPNTTQDLLQVQAQPGSLADQLAEAYALLKTDDVQSLMLTLHIAQEQGIVVVAAAGNDSWRDEYRTKPLAPQSPAAYPFVISVAGSNANRQRSCFSNWGDVSAPAGDGAPGEVETASGKIPTSCAASFETPLISVAADTPRFPLRYAKWNGTSFATPLVSGLAALVLDAEAQQGTRWVLPRYVAQAIKCGAAASDGVINVPITLVRCLRP
ncbi:MAG TPA: S8/S53 family peptidase [Anaerolineae bacterium]